MPTAPEWPQTAVEILRGMAGAGCSARQISHKIKYDVGIYFSRSAVIGKAHRLGLSLGLTRQKVWSPARLEHLAKLWNSPDGLTRKEMAEQIGVNERDIGNGIKDLKRKMSRSAAAKTATAKKVRRGRGKTASFGDINLRNPFTEPADEADVSWLDKDCWTVNGHPAVRLVDLGADSCRWSLGDPAVFCGRKIYPHKPYCAGHCRIAYRVA